MEMYFLVDCHDDISKVLLALFEFWTVSSLNGSRFSAQQLMGLHNLIDWFILFQLSTSG